MTEGATTYPVRPSEQVAVGRRFLFWAPPFLFVLSVVILVKAALYSGPLWGLGGLVVEAALLIPAIYVLWTLTYGPLGLSPHAIRISSASIDFLYARGRILTRPWDSRRFTLLIEDVEGAWDRSLPGARSHRLFLETPRGAPVVINESVAATLVQRATESGLRVTKQAPFRRYDSNCTRTLIRRAPSSQG